ncbi:hypothetical protein KBA27_03665 [bacterium]|nr:hypothetical protein [bacterium]
METNNFMLSEKANKGTYDNLYAVFATNYELSCLSNKIYACKNIYSHKMGLKKIAKGAA